MIATLENLQPAELIVLVHQQQSQIQKLQDQLTQLLRAMYGKKSEKFPLDPLQTTLPLDLPAEVQQEKKKETLTYTREKSSPGSKHKGRIPLPDYLERIITIIEPKDKKEGMEKIGEEISEYLEFAPGKVYVRKTIRPKYAQSDGEGVIIAPLPSMPIERGIAGPGLLANIIIEKYVDHLPLYRQIERYKREGVIIPSSTMSDWISDCSKLITPLHETLKRIVLTSRYLQVDETPIQVLDRAKKGKSHRGYYWVYRDPLSGLVLFDYRPGRGRDGPMEILKSFGGYLQCDGYSIYENFDKGNIVLIHCMAHARRKFEQALKNHAALAEFALHEMQKLYAVERRAREEQISHEQRYQLRQSESLPVLKALHQWLKENIQSLPPESAIAKAFYYSLSRWEKLMIYASDGKLEIDNNLVENAIRPIAIGRKNYLFAGSHQSAQNAAMMYSLLGTCKLKGVEPWAWLKNIFEVLPDHKANRLEELLP